MPLSQHVRPALSGTLAKAFGALLARAQVIVGWTMDSALEDAPRMPCGCLLPTVVAGECEHYVTPNQYRSDYVQRTAAWLGINPTASTDQYN